MLPRDYLSYLLNGCELVRSRNPGTCGTSISAYQGFCNVSLPKSYGIITGLQEASHKLVTGRIFAPVKVRKKGKGLGGKRHAVLEPLSDPAQSLQGALPAREFFKIVRTSSEDSRHRIGLRGAGDSV